MDPATQRRLDIRARIIKALAHPTRLFIAEELARGERCVCELTELIGADISTVSKHLALMKNAGIVRDDRRGLKVYYHLQAPCALRFLECAETILRNTLAENLDDLGNRGSEPQPAGGCRDCQAPPPATPGNR